MKQIRCDEIRTPLGTVSIAVSERGLCGLIFGTRRELIARPWLTAIAHHEPIVQASDPDGFSRCVRAYFEGDLGAFDHASLDPPGTPFQTRVWQAVRAIPAGRTTSYGDIARAVDCPRAARAVGAANGANRIALAIPCHRVVGSTGGLTGYAYGTDRKHWLLQHEADPGRSRAHASEPVRFGGRSSLGA